MLGELTGALAHELSQPLTAVRSNAQAARHFLNRDPLDVSELRAALDDIIRNNKRAGTVIDRLRALLRKEDTALQPVNMNEVVREVIDLAHSEILVAPHHADEPAGARDSARAGRSRATAAGGAQSRAECVRCDERARMRRSDSSRSRPRWRMASCSSWCPTRRRDSGEPARAGVRAIRHVPRAGSRPRACDQPLDRDRAPRIDPGREQRRWRRDVPLFSAGRKHRSKRLSARRSQAPVTTLARGAVEIVPSNDPVVVPAARSNSRRTVKLYAPPRYRKTILNFPNIDIRIIVYRYFESFGGAIHVATLSISRAADHARPAPDPDRRQLADVAIDPRAAVRPPERAMDHERSGSLAVA